MDDEKSWPLVIKKWLVSPHPCLATDGKDACCCALLDLHERLLAVERKAPGVERVDVTGPARRYTAPGFAIPVDAPSPLQPLPDELGKDGFTPAELLAQQAVAAERAAITTWLRGAGQAVLADIVEHGGYRGTTPTERDPRNWVEERVTAAAADERESIVEWLRDYGRKLCSNSYEVEGTIYERAAGQIEGGRHHEARR